MSGSCFVVCDGDLAFLRSLNVRIKMFAKGVQQICLCLVVINKATFPTKHTK